MKEFYFVRHGQTDHNILEAHEKKNLSQDISINETGKNQAATIEPVIARLSIQIVCASPLKRAQETKNIIAARLKANHLVINDFGECSAEIWKELTRHGTLSPIPEQGKAREFIERVQNGMNLALSQTGTPLIVAHGGVHWAICYLLGIQNHDWAIDNCAIVHFSIDEHNRWNASKL